MAVHSIRRGLDLPITGEPIQKIESASAVTKVALMAEDYPLMKPRMHVNVGDKVKRGTLLFEDRKTDGVRFTAPAAGEVVAINRGERRALISLVIALNDAEQRDAPGAEDHEDLGAVKPAADLDAARVREVLVQSGAWTALRQRPYGNVPSPTGDGPRSIFVTAIDSHPLSPDASVVISEHAAAFKAGLHAVSKLTEGTVWVCKRGGAKLDVGDAPRVKVEEFTGKHPCGVVGTHIHTLDPVFRGKTVWHLGYQDVIAWGKLFETGKLFVERVVSIGGPAAAKPRLLRTRLGASVVELTTNELKDDGEHRVVAGSVLYGRAAHGDEYGYLGRYHNQISVLNEDRERVFFGWLRPGGNKFSTIPAFLAGWLGNRKKFDFTTTTNGSHRAMVPIGMFEKVMPLDLMPTFLLRALVMDDLSRAEELGCLELDEEDLSLCTFVSPGKEDYGVALRRNLTTIWKEG